MRNSINGLWLLGIVLTFMMFFIAFISITFNYSNAFKMKTELVNTYEQYQGVNNKSISKANSILKSYGYSLEDTCKPGSDGNFVGVTSDGSVEKNKSNKKYSYCITRTVDTSTGNIDTYKYYYNVTVFFKLSLPLFGDLLTFRVSGETNPIEYPYEQFF